MGGKSKSSSSSTQKTTTNQTDRRIGATDNAVVVNAEPNSSLDIQLTDERAFDLANKTLEGVAVSFDKVLQTVDKTLEANTKTIEAANAGGTNTLIKWGAVAALGYGVVKVLK